MLTFILFRFLFIKQLIVTYHLLVYSRFTLQDVLCHPWADINVIIEYFSHFHKDPLLYCSLEISSFIHGLTSMSSLNIFHISIKIPSCIALQICHYHPTDRILFRSLSSCSTVCLEVGFPGGFSFLFAVTHDIFEQ